MLAGNGVIATLDGAVVVGGNLELIREKGTIHVDNISELSGIKISELSALLLNLEFKNVVRSIRGNSYMIC